MRADTKHRFRKLAGRVLALASLGGLSLGILCCGASNTIDYLYVTSNSQNPGQINVYHVDSESGALYKIADSPYPSGGRNPVYEVASSNGLYLYVANHDDNTIVKFDIGTDGKLYPIQTVETPGTEPVALALNASGTVLYVLDYYAPASPGQPSYTDLNPGPGAVIAYPIDAATGTLGAPLGAGAADYWLVQCFPTNLAVTPDGSYVYVTNTNAVVVTTSPPVTGTVPILPASCPSYGTVSAFAVSGSSSSTGQTVTGLSPVAGSPFSTGTGSEPTAVTADPGNGLLYVTDSKLNQLDTYAIQSGGALSLSATNATGNMPMGATVVSNGGKYLYVTNYIDGTISIFSLSSGLPSPVATSSAGASGPLCLLIDPDTQRFMYISDYTGGRIGGVQLDPSTGNLIQTEGSPYATAAGQPTCVAAVVHAGGNKNGL